MPSKIRANRAKPSCGRIGTAQAWLGGALKIKPILTLDNEITPVERRAVKEACSQASEPQGVRLVWSGRKITVGACRLSTTCSALDDVQQISTSALTSAEVLT